MADKDVIVRLRVERDNGRALADLSKQAKDAEQQVSRLGKAMADVQRGGRGPGGGNPPAAAGRAMPGGGSMDFMANAMRGYLTVEALNSGVRSFAEAMKLVGDTSATTADKVRSIAQALPFIGGAAAGVVDLVQLMRGVPEANRAQVELAGGLDRTMQGRVFARQGQAQFNQFITGLMPQSQQMPQANREMVESRRELAAATKQVARFEERLRNQPIIMPQAANRFDQWGANVLGAMGVLQPMRRDADLVDIQRYRGALGERQAILEQLIGSQQRYMGAAMEDARTKYQQRRAAEIQGGDFATMDPGMQREALALARRVRAGEYGKLTGDERQFFDSVGLFQGLGEQARIALSKSSPLAQEAMKIAAEVRVQIQTDADNMAKEVLRQLGPVAEDMKVAVKALADVKTELLRANDLAARAMQNMGAK